MLIQRKREFLRALLCAALAVGAQAGAANYYVSLSGDDASPGTEQRPFLTIRHGLSVLLPGDTLFVRGGTYEERLYEIDFRASGVSWSTPMTVAAYPAETVRLRPTGGNTARFQDGTVAYVVIRGLILDGLLAGGGAGGAIVYCGPLSHHLRFEGVELVNGDGNGAHCTGSDHEFRNMKVHNNGLSPAYRNSNGMYMTTDRTVIVGGEFYNNECYGVRFMDSAHPASTSDDNVVRGARIYGNGFGIGLDGASACESGGGGIVLGDVNNTAMNNLVYGNWWGFTSSWARASEMKLYNNTFYDNRNGVEIGADAVNASVMNNIMYRNGSVDLVNASQTTTMSHNLLTDPDFVNAPADFRLRAGSHALDAGATIPSVVDDYAGTPRPWGAGYDIGAYEYRGTSAPASPVGLTVT